ncbi:MAG: arginine transporter [Pseudomonadota bacterium]
MRIFIALLLMCALAACGGRSVRAPAGVTFASGPISAACLAAGRQNASRASCQCIQGVADDTLSRGDQRTGATFFDDPERGQDVRLDDSPAADAFWERWTTYAEAAEDVCRAVL